MNSKQKENLFISAIVLLVALGILHFTGHFPYFYYVYNLFAKETLVETFDDNRNGWIEHEHYEKKTYIENGRYIFESNSQQVKKQNKKDFIKVNFPSEYRVELALTSNKKGKSFLKLWNRQGKNVSFIIHMSYQRVEVYDNVVGTLFHKEEPSLSQSKINTLIISVKNGKTQFFINDHLVYMHKGILVSYPTTVELFSNSERTEFHSLKAYNETNGVLVLDEPFDNYANGWKPYVVGLKQAKITDGNCYLYSTVTSRPKSAVTRIPITPGNSYEVIVRSTWRGQQGSTALYGFTLDRYHPQEEASIYLKKPWMYYYSFVLKSNGETWMQYQGEKGRNHPGFTSEVKKTTSVSNGENTIEQRVVVKGSEVKYYLNDEFIASYDKRLQVNSLILWAEAGPIAFDYVEIK
ncbi:MAG: hypothetical protein ACFB0B_18475 [Thermonemataceae bacterium]